jgi:hypothetical protein
MPGEDGEPVYFRARQRTLKTASEIVAEPLDFTPGPAQLSDRKHRRSQNQKPE